MDDVTGSQLVLWTVLGVVGFVALTVPFALRYMRGRAKPTLRALTHALSELGTVRQPRIGIAGRISFWLNTGERRCDIWAVRREDNNGRDWILWQASLHPVAAGQRTKLSFGRAGYASLLRNKMGFADLTTGDETFDLDFDVYADNDDEGRALLDSQPVKTAVRHVLGPHQRGIQVWMDAMRILEMRMDHAHVEDVHTGVKRLVQLADALDARHEDLGRVAVKGLPPSGASDLAAVVPPSHQPVMVGSRSVDEDR